MPKITGGKAHAARLKYMVSAEAIRSVGAALFAGGQRIEAYAARSITEGSASEGRHIPSAPGTPPNNDSGVLARNIETVLVGPTHVEVSSNAIYSAAQEFGNSRLPARPFMAPAAAAERDAVKKLVDDAMIRIAKGGRIR